MTTHTEREPASVPSPPEIPARYEIEELVGEGGMARVYRATDLTLGRAVAVKLLHPHVSRERAFVEQFLAMERRVARLHHPNLVTIYDAGFSDDACYVVMEYLPRGSLRDRLAADQRPNECQALRLAAQVAAALEALHQERILHGDVKPDNVLLDDDGNAKLVDFGIARLATTTGTIPANIVGGTAPYLSPEQVEHGYGDARSDVYALGLLTYELLAGRLPFQGDTWAAVATQRLATDPTPLSVYAPGVSDLTERVVMLALARDPEARYPSAHAFRAALLEAAKPGSARSLPPVTEPLTPPVGPVQHPVPPTAPVAIPRQQPSVITRRGATRPRLERVAADVRQRLCTASPATLAAIAAVSLVALLLVGVVLSSRSISTGVATDQVASPVTVAVPGVVDSSLGDAQVELERYGLRIGEVRLSAVDGERAGTVIAQEPAANARLREGDAVSLTVSIPNGAVAGKP